VLPAFKTSAPPPDSVTVPAPLMSPANVKESLRLKTNAPLSVTFPEMLPVVPRLPIWSAPLAMVVPPLKLLFAVRIKIPVPSLITLPVPLIVPPNATVSLLLNAKIPSLTTDPTILPVVNHVSNDASGRATVAQLKGSGNDRSTTGVGVSSGQGNFSRTVFHQSAEAADDPGKG